MTMNTRLILGLLLITVVFNGCKPVGETLADFLPPSGNSVSINGSGALTNSTSVSLTLSSSDAVEMYITNTAGCASGGAWQAYATSKAWTLGQSNGTATVYAKFKDRIGNETSCVSDTIVHDSVAPTVSNVTSATANGSFAVGGSVAVQVVFSEAVTVVGTPRISLETGPSDALVNYSSGSGSTTLVFSYTVGAGQNSTDLDYVSTSALALNGGTILDAAGNTANLTLASPGAANSLGANKAIVIDTAAPTVTNVTSGLANSTYSAGTTIPVQVVFSEAVTVTGTPQLTLETGATDAVVNYTSGSGTTTLTFNYIVAAEHDSADLNYASTSALALNGGTIADALANNATLTLPGLAAAGSLATNKALVIGTVPSVASVTSSSADASYKNGAVIPIQVVFSEAVTVTGTPQLTLETGATDAVVNYSSGSGTSTLVFEYTVSGSETSADLDYVATNSLTLNGGTIVDSGSNNATLTLATPGATHSLGSNKNLVIDTTVPSVSNVTSSTGDGTYGVGTVIPIQVVFSEAVTVTGTPQLTLETGATDAVLSYTSGSGSTTLVFNYTVTANQTSADLDYTATTSLNLNGGSISDVAGNTANLTLASPGAAGSLGANKALVIDTVAPIVTNVTSSTTNGLFGLGGSVSVQVVFDDTVTVDTNGGTPRLILDTSGSGTPATYASGSGSNTLTFNYTVIAGDNSSDLDYKGTASLELNGGTIRDASGNSAVLTLAAPAAAGSLGANKALVVDTTAPTSPLVVIDSGNTYTPDQAVQLTTLSASGSPTHMFITNSDTACDSQAAGSAGWLDMSDPANATPFAWTLGSSNNIEFVYAKFKDAVGNVSACASDSIIRVPAVSSVSASNTNGTYGAGQTISVQVVFDAEVDVTGTPQLTLETGASDAVVNYTSGTGSSTLVFNYVIGAGQNSADLDYLSTSALALNSGTIQVKSGSTNATLTLPAVAGVASLGGQKNIRVDTAFLS